MGGILVQFLLDKGAAVSVVCYDTLIRSLQQQVVSVHVATIGANGSPLDVTVVGQITAPIVVNGLNCIQLLTVVMQLSVAGILGADFLVKHGVLIDCRNSRLLLGDPQTIIPVKIVGASQALVVLCQ